MLPDEALLSEWRGVMKSLAKALMETSDD